MAFVVVAVLVLLWNSNVIQRGKTALTIGDENYSAAQVQYSYYAAYTEVRSSNYYSYMGIDTSKSLAGQTMSDTAKALLGVTDEGITWDKYLLDKAKSNLGVQPIPAGRRRKGRLHLDGRYAGRL